VRQYQRSGQTLIGFYIDECYYHSLLRPMLVATAGKGMSVFGMLRSHNGPRYCPTVYPSAGPNSSQPAQSGQQLNWTTAASTLATLSVEFPHFIGFTVDDFYCMMQDPNTPSQPADPKLSVAVMQEAHTAMKAIAPNFLFMPTVYPTCVSYP
jgi:hypothetical protein